MFYIAQVKLYLCHEAERYDSDVNVKWQGLKAEGAAHLTEQRLTYTRRVSNSNLRRHTNRIHTRL
jgi:hypothetical protein